MKRRNRVAFFNILSTVLLRGISIFTAPLFTRLLGNSGYGVTQIYNTWVSVIAIVFALQTQGTLANARTEYDEGEQLGYQSSAMTLSTLAYLVCSGLVLCFLSPISNALKLSRFLVVLMLLQGFGTFCLNFLNTKFVYEFKAGRNMVLSLMVALVTLVLSVVLILQLPREINYLGRIGAISATYGLLGIPVCIWILVKGKTFFHKKYWKFCIALAIPAAFYSLSDLVLGHCDKVMLQQLVDEATVGCYAAALNFSGIMYTLFAALNNSWCPFFFEDMKQGNREGLREKTENFLELYTVLSVGFVLLAREVYRVYVGKDFWSSTMLIPVFVSSYYLNFLCNFPVNFETYHKKTKVVAAITIVSSLINVGLNYLLIRRMGMAGAAVATLASHCLQLTLHWLYARFCLGGREYPFGLKLCGKYAVVFAAVAVVCVCASQLPILRWGAGAFIGVWELWRIKKRKALI
ncbi:MAG: oligosaccharide flippase family protein [Firmicutes bacterium]|nr:oligosaccharide flippase family protein [Bacillota bacterium]